MRRIVLAAVLVASFVALPILQEWPVAHLQAAIGIVPGQIKVIAGMDQTTTMDAAPAVGNVVVVFGVTTSDGTTVTLSGTASAPTTLFGADTGAKAAFAFCFAGDGADASWLNDTAGGGHYRGVAIELSGTDGCTLDGTPDPDGVADAVEAYNLDPLYTTTLDNSILLGCIGSSSASNYSGGTGVSQLPTDGADIGTTALCGFKITTTAGDYDLEFTSDGVNETSEMFAVALAEDTGGGAGPPAGSLMLLGVGR